MGVRSCDWCLWIYGLGGALCVVIASITAVVKIVKCLSGVAGKHVPWYVYVQVDTDYALLTPLPATAGQG